MTGRRLEPNSWRNPAKDAGEGSLVVRLLASRGVERVLAQPTVFHFVHVPCSREAGSEVLTRVADHEVEIEPPGDRLIDDQRDSEAKREWNHGRRSGPIVPGGDLVIDEGQEETAAAQALDELAVWQVAGEVDLVLDIARS